MRTLVTIVSLLLVVLGTGASHAHAFLDHASPLVGSTVPTAPQEVATVSASSYLRRRTSFA
jgi:methionine-rich copper-binding protein CopC